MLCIPDYLHFDNGSVDQMSKVLNLSKDELIEKLDELNAGQSSYRIWGFISTVTYML